MQTEDGLKSTFTQQLVKALLQSKIVNKDIDNITEAGPFHYFFKNIEHEWVSLLFKPF